ncbi:MAG TPA: EAL domain-containing protein, partial [Pseudonocardia sp.]|nr:EAL domain-containing protein [Pseudonocardia sp.]
DAFGLTAVAEGVQTEAEVAALRELGCRFGQGYLWGEARPAEALTVFSLPGGSGRAGSRTAP